MRIDLRLQLLQLGALGSDLLLKHLLNEQLQPLHHQVEMLIQVMKLVIMPVAQLRLGTGYVHLAKGPDHPMQRLMNPSIDPAREQNDHQQREAGKAEKQQPVFRQRPQKLRLRHINNQIGIQK